MIKYLSVIVILLITSCKPNNDDIVRDKFFYDMGQIRCNMIHGATCDKMKLTEIEAEQCEAAKSLESAMAFYNKHK